MMRGKESRYLKPLMLKVDNLLEHGISQPLLLPPNHAYNSDKNIVPTGNGSVYQEAAAEAQKYWRQCQ